jgi:hypothetical protein
VQIDLKYMSLEIELAISYVTCLPLPIRAYKASDGKVGNTRTKGWSKIWQEAKTMTHGASTKVQKTRVTCHVVSCDTLFAQGNIEHEFTQGCTCIIAFYCESHPLAKLKVSMQELDV